MEIPGLGWLQTSAMSTEKLHTGPLPQFLFLIKGLWHQISQYFSQSLYFYASKSWSFNLMTYPRVNLGTRKQV